MHNYVILSIIILTYNNNLNIGLAVSKDFFIWDFVCDFDAGVV